MFYASLEDCWFGDGTMFFVLKEVIDKLLVA